MPMSDKPTDEHGIPLDADWFDCRCKAVASGAIRVVGPETFTDAAQPLVSCILELERNGAPRDNIRRARELLNEALAEMDAAFSAPR
jgi:hypothetical protein